MKKIILALLATIAACSAAHGATQSSYPSKSSVVDADKFLLSDSEASNATKNAAASTLKSYVLADIVDATFTAPVLYSGGNFSLALDTDLSSTSASDDTVPSAKATKAAIDAISVTGFNPTIQVDDPTGASANGTYLATTSGDMFYLAAPGIFNISAGTFTAWDTVPTSFGFGEMTNAVAGDEYCSSAYTVAGIDRATSISATTATYKINGSASSASTVSLGDTVSACLTASTTPGATVTGNLTIGGVAGDPAFSLTTLANQYSDILLFNRMEALTLTTGDCYGADNTMSGGGAISISSTAGMVGTNGISVAGAGYYMLDVTSKDIFDAASGRVGMWHRWTDAFNNNQEIFRAANAATIDTNNLSLWHSGGALKFGVITSGTRPTDLATTGITFSLNQPYFIEIAWDVATGYREIFVDGVSRGTSTTSLVEPVINRLYFGSYFSGAGTRHDDHYIVSNDKTRNLYALRNTASCPK